jgi:predicted dehydrogenase
MDRRDFLKTASALAVTIGVGSSLSQAQVQSTKQVSANEKIILGFIGLGGRGFANMAECMKYPDVEVGAVCDVYEKRLQEGVAYTNGKAKAYKDFRKLLEQKDIDAVVISTPPHWHPLMTIYACQEGKDVYCEKPISRYVAEARAMAKVAHDNKRVTQVGTQIHASENFRRCVEIVKSGILGKIMAVRIVCTMNEYPGGIGRPADSSPPEGLDWDLWCGPAPLVPFNEARFTAHRYFSDYVASWLSELGPHIIDLAFWAMNPSEPLAVSASGGRFVADDISDIPDTMDVIWEFPGFVMTWMHTSGNSFNFDFGGPPDRGRRLGVIFHGTKGTLLGDYNTFKIVPEGDALKDIPMPEPSIPPSPGHHREWLDAIKTREQPLCNLDYHLPIATAIDLAHVSLKVGRKLYWDSSESKVIGDKEANALLIPKYRKPWTFPKV